MSFLIARCGTFTSSRTVSLSEWTSRKAIARIQTHPQHSPDTRCVNFPSLRSSEHDSLARKVSCYNSTMEQQELIEKIKRLPQDQVAEVESFVDSLARRANSSYRENLHQALTDYAIQHAGTDADF